MIFLSYIGNQLSARKPLYFRSQRYRALMGLLLAIWLFSISFTAQGQAIENIKQRGYLLAGVKADYQPYGFKDNDGNLAGLEIDLAQNIAERLGVDLKLMVVKSSNRMRFLVDDQVDMVIATMSDRLERRKVISFVEPSYYASGTNVLAWKSAKLHSWEQLHKQKVCGIRGAFYNHTTKMDFGANMVIFEDTDKAMLALRKGECLAFVYDDSFINHQLNDVRWQKRFEMPLNSIKTTPWGIGIKQGEEAFQQQLKAIIIDWHKSGFIIQLEKKYAIKVSPFTLEMYHFYQ